MEVDIDTTCPKASARFHWHFFFFFFEKLSDSHFLGENTYFLADSWAWCKLHSAVSSLSNGVNIRVRGHRRAVSIKRSCKYHVGAHAKRTSWCTDVGRHNCLSDRKLCTPKYAYGLERRPHLDSAPVCGACVHVSASRKGFSQRSHSLADSEAKSSLARD